MPPPPSPTPPPPTPWDFALDRVPPGEDLIGIGADLDVATLFEAYSVGVFPMGIGDHGAEPIGWWSPDPRGILRPRELRVSRSLRKAVRHFEVQGRHRLPVGRRGVRRARPRRTLDHRGDRRRVRRAAPGRVGALGRGVAGRHPRRRSLRRRHRRPLRGRVDVPPRARRLEGRPRRPVRRCSEPTATRAASSTSSGRRPTWPRWACARCPVTSTSRSCRRCSARPLPACWA